MKKLATILALLCAAAFAKEYEYMVQSMSYGSLGECKEKHASKLRCGGAQARAGKRYELLRRPKL